MTQEEKQLLLKDLCARLPYGTKVCYRLSDKDKYTTETLSGHMLDYFNENSIIEVKPYLRSMSIMTEEEREELKQLSDGYLEDWTNAQTPIDKWKLDGKISYNRSVFYNSHHLDWNGLIEKGLALEATEKMYKND